MKELETKIAQLEAELAQRKTELAERARKIEALEHRTGNPLVDRMIERGLTPTQAEDLKRVAPFGGRLSTGITYDGAPCTGIDDAIDFALRDRPWFAPKKQAPPVEWPTDFHGRRLAPHEMTPDQLERLARVEPEAAPDPEIEGVAPLPKEPTPEERAAEAAAFDRLADEYGRREASRRENMERNKEAFPQQSTKKAWG